MDPPTKPTWIPPWKLPEQEPELGTLKNPKQNQDSDTDAVVELNECDYYNDVDDDDDDGCNQETNRETDHPKIQAFMILSLLCDWYIRQVKELMAHKKFADAEKLFTTVLNLHSLNISARKGRAVAFLCHTKYQLCIKDLNKALEPQCQGSNNPSPNP